MEVPGTEEHMEVPETEEHMEVPGTEEPGMAVDTRKSEMSRMQQLEKLEGIDIRTGLLYCMNDEDFYVEMLGEYLESDLMLELEQVFSDEDWGNYRTLVHALKSTSLTIGAVHLSGQAKELETAAKNGDADYIRSHHKAVLEEYSELIGGIREILDLFLC